ncbi:MAG: tryptophan synthase subunit alpha [Planctomycetota bacterium]
MTDDAPVEAGPETTNRVDAAFASRRADNARAIMPFVCGGHPTVDALTAVLPALDRAGAAVIEIGIPFSDPIADGPVIAAAMHEALTAGVRPETVFEQVAGVRAAVGAGIIAMVSVSIVEGLGGPAKFAERAAEAGIDGLIIPDLPLEEAAAARDAAAAHGLTMSLLVAPTTPPPRAAEIAGACSGFVYVVARSGVTGERQGVPDIKPLVDAVRDGTDLPVACGFGISTAEHVRAVVEHADAAIVGSALVRNLTEANRAGDDLATAAESFTRELAMGLGSDRAAEMPA